ncbi:MAG: phosphoglucosamine mutase [Deltaproteobacteria bacterium]|nr:phosphoglucosamine mutase [Deltaproteobacteria bacterium]MBF0526867.1 phosphoglucosamine mutase [Deltaproteobacteria bacterium]
MNRLFGTDGIRGRANVPPMTVDTVMKVGQSAAQVCHTRPGRCKIVIGKDTRLSGYMIESAIASGICSMGVDVLLAGVLPTPGIAFITTSMRADAGIVISASHNPFHDNGIKIFNSDGFKLPDELEQKIENLVFQAGPDSIQPSSENLGRISRITDANGRFTVFLKNTFPRHLSLDGLKIVLDCAHGAAYKVAPAVLSELGADLILLGAQPDGKNINHQCGSLYPALLASAVIKESADLGVALDGDGDRAIFVDETGQVIDGDQVMAICASHLHKQGKLNNNTLVATVMSNLGLEVCLAEMGVQLVRTKVGDRWVVEEMLRRNCNLGGEQSGHIIFLDHNTTGDGILACLQILAIMLEDQRRLSELAGIMTRYPQVLLNVKVSHKKKLDELPEVASLTSRVTRELGGKGRVLIRYSGTEPLVRVMLEGEDASVIRKYAEQLASCLNRALG